MKLEVGHYYRTRDGRKVLVEEKTRHKHYPFEADNGLAYAPCGSWITGTTDGDDLIAEWTDEPLEVGFGEPVGREFGAGPVRTVTRKEIVPGVYGLVRVYSNFDIDMKVATTAADLAAAIETLTAIKEAME